MTHTIPRLVCLGRGRGEPRGREVPPPGSSPECWTASAQVLQLRAPISSAGVPLSVLPSPPGFRAQWRHWQNRVNGNGVHLGEKQLTFRSTELEGTTGHLIGTIPQGIRNPGLGVEKGQSKRWKFGSHGGENWRKGECVFEVVTEKEKQRARVREP